MMPNKVDIELPIFKNFNFVPFTIPDIQIISKFRETREDRQWARDNTRHQIDVS
jgi:hypothetical protein